MKKIVNILFLFSIFLPLLFCSCSRRAVAAYDSRTLDVERSVITVPLLSQLQVSSSAVSATMVVDKHNKLPINSIKSHVVEQALSTVDADLLFDPKFTITYKKQKVTSISVTGYPAEYLSFRNYQPSDSILLNSKMADKGVVYRLVTPQSQSLSTKIRNSELIKP